MIKDLHASDHRIAAAGGCGGPEPKAEVAVGGGGGGEIWLGGTHSTDDLLAAVDDSLFYGGDFPPLPDFPCMSSSSSTSSTPAPVKPVGAGGTTSSSTSSASSSSAASWAVLKSDNEEDRRDRDVHRQDDVSNADRTAAVDVGSTQAAAGALSSTASMELSQPHDRDQGDDHYCMDVMESFDYMDQLIESSNDFFDPCSLFQQDYPPEDFQVPDLKLGQNQDQDDQFRQNFGSGGHYLENDQSFMMIPTSNNNNDGDKNNCSGGLTQDRAGVDDSVDDLGSVFLEWLKNNKETVCAEDLRRVKIKKATIECAAKRLGGGREAMKQLLKLILEWVQSNHLHKRRDPGPAVSNISYQDPPPAPFQNPNPSHSLDPSTFAWNFPEPPSYDPAAAACPPVYVGVDPYCSNNLSSGAAVVAPPLHQPYPAVAATGQDYGNNNNHMLDSAQTWPASHFGFQAPTYNFNPNPMMAGFGYNNQYQYFQGNNNGDKLARLGSSATKEARKKRMARQRRFFAHRGHNNFQQNQSADQLHARPGGENCTSNPGGWMYHWPAGPLGPPGLPVDGQKAAGSHLKQNSANDRRQGWKPEKNLRFLLQKVLKQSDVGNLGRIVLPKKEAETHLPELEARDGIAISMEDIGTSRVWNMRYRFWPNNKSRMYLLENTGDFVRTNGLQEGDFIVIYSDVKCGKYLIRGVKVRQPGAKTETKRPAKAPRNQLCASPAGTAPSSSPVTQTTK